MNTNTNAIQKSQCQDLNGSCGCETSAASTASEVSQWFYRPDVDIVEGRDAYRVVADMPGVSPESIDVTLERGELTLQGRAPARYANSARMKLQEYGVGDYFRRFHLGDMADAVEEDQVSAEYRDGVLTVVLPKRAHVQPRKVTVRTTSG